MGNDAKTTLVNIKWIGVEPQMTTALQITPSPNGAVLTGAAGQDAEVIRSSSLQRIMLLGVQRMF